MTEAASTRARTEVTGSDLLLMARQQSRASMVFGIVLVSLGVFAVMAPLFSGIATAVLVGMLLVAGGIVESIFAFQAPSFGKGVLRFLFGALAVVAGVVVLSQPGRGLGALTIILAVYFIASGIVDIVLAFKLRPEDGWGWALFSGIVTLLLAALIIWQWPVSGVWAVGIYVGVRLLMHGWMLMALGTAGRDALTYLRDQRLEALERHVRAGLSSLQNTQIVLVAHTAMLLALDNELRKKVAAEEVDPAIRKLNAELGEARAQMERAAAATAEAWDAAQTEANRSFEALHESAAEVVERLQKELGIDKA